MSLSVVGADQLLEKRLAGERRHVITITDLHKRFGRRSRCCAAFRFAGRARRSLRAARPVGRRQEHAARA